MVSFEDLTLNNLNAYKKAILRSELIYPKPLRSPLQAYINTLKSQGYVAIIAKEAGKYVGNAIGFLLDDPEEIKEVGTKVSNGDRVLYVLNLVVDREYQGKGIGFGLMKEVIRRAREKGFHKVVGHFRKNRSLEIFTGLGGKRLWSVPNWEGSGEEFVYCELSLK